MLDFSTIEWRATRHEGVSLNFLRSDRETGDATVLIRMRPGSAYPSHRHTGLEEVLILQGGYKDHQGEHRAGDYLINRPGSAHHPIALDLPEDCIMLAIVHGGIELLQD